jgi:CYTH domain-containing protein
MIRTTFIFSLFVSCFFWVRHAYAQQEPIYDSLVTQAFGFYEIKEYKASAEKYAEAFIALGGKGYPGDRYNAACSWALAGAPDSAFVQLFNISTNGAYTNLEHITSDSDLNTLHQDKRWKIVISQVTKNKEKQEVNYDKPLVKKLDAIYHDDQSHRIEINGIQKKYGWKSPQMDSLWKVIEWKDSLNLIEVRKILDTRGWLGADIVGGKGNSTLFLVIQHADQKIQEQYLPMMREAVAKGNAAASSLALLEDRVALGQGKKQIYGSQIGMFSETGENYVLPLEDPDNVDERRMSVGLGKLQDYINHWGLTWNVDEYKKNLPRYEGEQKK